MSEKSASYLLFAIAAFVFVGSNASLFASGWISEFEKRLPRTGIYILDLLLAFFPEMLANPSAKTVYDILGGVAVTAASAVVFEGNRRRGEAGFSRNLLAAYWWIAQFVAIGLATPLFFGLYLLKPMPDSKYVHVSPLVSLTVFFALLLTGGINVQLESSIIADAFDYRILIAWLLIPVVLISASVYFDKSSSSPMNKLPIQATYVMAFIVGLVGYYRVLALVLAGGFKMDEFRGNAPGVFLVFDCFGVLSSIYIWLFADKRISIFTLWPIAVLCGPGSHLALLCLMRENNLDDRIADKKS